MVKLKLLFGPEEKDKSSFGTTWKKSSIGGAKVWKELQSPCYPVLESGFEVRSSWEVLPCLQI